MRTVVRSTATSVAHSLIDLPQLMAQAAETCIQQAGARRKDIDLLINVGVYRSDNIVEPALAALVQKKLDLNIAPYEHVAEDGYKTFSFDLISGSCGFLYAVRAVDSLINAGKVSCALIVSGDMHPSMEPKPEFPFRHVAAAVLLGASNEDGKGFEDFAFSTSREYHTGREGSVDLAACIGNGRQMIAIRTDADYYDELHAFAVDRIRGYLRERTGQCNGVKLISSQPRPGFARDLAESLALGEDSAVDSYDQFGIIHTAALTVGFQVAMEKNQLQEGSRVLFADVGSGLTAALALYTV